MSSAIEQQVWNDVFAAVKQRNPDIEIEVLNVPYEGYWSKLFTMTAAGNPPDLVMMESGFYQSFVKSGALQDLSARIAQSKSITLADYHKSPLQWLKVDEKIYGLPSDTAVILPFFNLDLFEKAGVAVPGPDWTWDDYLRVAKQLTRDENQDGTPEVYGTNLPPWESAVWSWTGSWVDDPEAPTRCTFDDPRTVAAIQWIADSIHKEKVAFWTNPLDASQPDYFLAGKVAISWNGHWIIPDYIAKAKFKWDVGMLPAGPVGRGGWNRGSCFSIPTHARHADKAWRVIEYICSAEGSKMFAAKNIMTPVNMAVCRSSEFLNMHPPQHQEYFIDALDFGHLLPKTPNFKELNTMIDTNLEHVWSGEKDSATICKQIAAEGTRILQRQDAPTGSAAIR